MNHAFNAPADTFVGRQRELSILERLYRECLSSSLRICLIRGESGIGKTALVTKFCDLIQKDPTAPQFASFCCTGNSATTGYVPFVKIVRILYHLDDEETKAEIAKTKRELQIVEFFKSTAPGWLELTGPLAGPVLETAKGLEKLLLPAFLRNAPIKSAPGFFEQLSLMLVERSRVAPVIIFLDEIDAIDKSSLELLLFLAKNPPQGKILIICAFERDMLQPQHENIIEQIGAAGATKIYDMQADMNVAQYLNLRYPDNDFPKDFVQKVQEQSEGLPGYVVQYLSLIKSRDCIEEVTDSAGKTTGCRITNLGQALQILEKSHDQNTLAAVRFNSLKDEIKKILCVASVEGQDFTAEVIARLRKLDHMEVVDQLSEMARKQQFITAASGRSSHEYEQILSLYQFLHRFLREYIYYGVIDENQRRIMHGEIGNCLEELYKDNLKDIYGQLALHFKNAGNTDKATKYALLASADQFSHYSLAEAYQFARIAYDIASRKPVSSNFPQVVAAAILIARCADRLGVFEDVPLIEKTVHEFERHPEFKKAEVEKYLLLLIVLGRIYYSMADYKKAVTFARQAVDVAQGIGNLVDVYEAKYLLADVVGDGLDDIEQQMTICQELYDISKELQDVSRQVDMLEMIAWAHLYMGNYDESISYSKEANHLLASAEIDDALLIAFIHRGLGLAFAGKGEYEAALTELKKSHAVSERIGDLTRMCWVEDEIGCTLREMRQYAQAKEHISKSLELGLSLYLTDVAAWCHTDLANIYLDTDELELASEHLDEASRGEDHLNAKDQSEFHLASARYSLAKGELTQARKEAARSLEIMEKAGSNLRSYPTYMIFGDIAMAENDLPSAEGWYQKLLDLAEKANLDVWKGRSYRKLAKIQQKQGRLQEAWENYEKSFRMIDLLHHEWETGDIWDDLLETGLQTSHIIELKKVHPCRFKAPQIKYVNVEIFKERFFSDCLNCQFCFDICCQYGADIEMRVIRNISAYTEPLTREVGYPKSDWFSEKFYQDPEVPGGKYTRTQKKQDRCIFLDLRSRGCKLQKISGKLKIDYHDIKPIVCCLFPVTFRKGLLYSSTEVYIRELICLDQGPTLYQGVRKELEYYFGSDLVSELDGIEGQRG